MRPRRPDTAHGLLATVLALSAVIVTHAHAADPGGPPAGLLAWKPGLQRLHSSRTNEALDWFTARKNAHPDEICGYYFPALVYTNFDVDGLTSEVETERGRELLDEGIKSGQQRLDRGEADPAARYCLGAMRGLRAAERLKRSKFMAAAFDAKHARQLMLDLLEERPGWVDCHFWVGSYDYFADVLPGIVKFFRSLLFFPKGDKERGLAAIRDVATSGNLDRYNALWMLHSLYRGLEKEPARSLEALERLLAIYPDNVDVRIALAWHYVVRAIPPDRDRAIEIHSAALGRIGEHGAGVASSSRKLRQSLAATYLNDLQPQAAVELLRPLLEETEDDPDRHLPIAWLMVRALEHSGRHPETAVVVETARSVGGDLPRFAEVERAATVFDEASSRLYGEVLAAWRLGRRGRLDEAETAFAALVSRSGPSGLVEFGRAEMYRDLERPADAERHYRTALELGIERPAELASMCRIRIGNLLDLRGEQAEARSFYRQAADSAGESEGLRELAKEYLKQGYEEPSNLRYP